MMQSGLSAMAAGNAAWLDMVERASRAGTAASDSAETRKAHLSGADVFGDLIEPGLRLGEAYQREIEAIFEKYRPDRRG